MSSFSELDGMTLRDTSNPPLTDKGSALTYGEFDANFVEIYNAIQDIVSGENVTAYDNVATYDAYSTDVYEQYCGYDSRIWKAVYVGSPSSFSGQTPAEGSYWTQVSLAQLLPNIMTLVGYAYGLTKAPKRYVAILTQTGTSDPNVEILENTLGNIVWTRGGTGSYDGTLAGVFTANKTYTMITPSGFDNDFIQTFGRASSDVVTIQNLTNPIAFSDGLVSTIEIRVYY